MMDGGDLYVALVVDGIIGAGKETYARLLAHELRGKGYDVIFVPEPVDKWVSCGILDKFYKDKKRWAYFFQEMTFYDKLDAATTAVFDYKQQQKQQLQEQPEQTGQHPGKVVVFILERSYITDQAFMQLMYREEYITDLEMNLFRRWWEHARNLAPLRHDLYVYLRPSVEICQERIKKRNRPGEEEITLDYQKALMLQHDNILTNKVNSRILDAPVIVITSDDDYKEDVIAQKAVLEPVIKKVEQIIDRRTGRPAAVHQN